jgi:hypothetical protein
MITLVSWLRWLSGLLLILRLSHFM